jgi:hypothetical protein
MRTITIEDPRDVADLLDKTFGTQHGNHLPSFGPTRWTCLHWHKSNDYVSAAGATPQDLIDDIRSKIAAHDPLAKLRKEAEAHGYSLMKLPQD